MASQIFDCEEETGVFPPNEIADRAIDLLRQITNLSRLSILQQKSPFIGLETGTRLRSPRDVFPIRRIKWRRIAARAGGNLLRRPACHRCNKDLVVGAGRFDFVDVARVSELLAV